MAYIMPIQNYTIVLPVKQKQLIYPALIICSLASYVELELTSLQSPMKLAIQLVLKGADLGQEQELDLSFQLIPKTRPMTSSSKILI